MINYIFRSRNRLVMDGWVSLIQVSHPSGLPASTKISLTVFKSNSSLTLYIVKETLKNTELRVWTKESEFTYESKIACNKYQEVIRTNNPNLYPDRTNTNTL